MDYILLLTDESMNGMYISGEDKYITTSSHEQRKCFSLCTGTVRVSDTEASGLAFNHRCVCIHDTSVLLSSFPGRSSFPSVCRTRTSFNRFLSTVIRSDYSGSGTVSAVLGDDPFTILSDIQWFRIRYISFKLNGLLT